MWQRISKSGGYVAPAMCVLALGACFHPAPPDGAVVAGARTGGTVIAYPVTPQLYGSDPYLEYFPGSYGIYAPYSYAPYSYAPYSYAPYGYAPSYNYAPHRYRYRHRVTRPVPSRPIKPIPPNRPIKPIPAPPRHAVPRHSVPRNAVPAGAQPGRGHTLQRFEGRHTIVGLPAPAPGSVAHPRPVPPVLTAPMRPSMALPSRVPVRAFPLRTPSSGVPRSATPPRPASPSHAYVPPPRRYSPPERPTVPNPASQPVRTAHGRH